MLKKNSPLLVHVAAFLVVLLLVGCGELPIAEGLKKAQADLDAGKGKEAIERLGAMAVKHPKDDSIAEALGFAQMNAGDAAKAGEIFNTLGLTKDADYHLYAAQAYKKANIADKAIESYRLYLLGEPKQAAPWQELGELLIATGNTPDGLQALEKSHALEQTPELAARIGTLYLQSGNTTQAERFLQNALKQARAKRPQGGSPQDLEGDILTQLVQIALTDKKSSEAERHLKQLGRDFPNNPKLAEFKKSLSDLQATQVKKEEKKPAPLEKIVEAEKAPSPAAVPDVPALTQPKPPVPSNAPIDLLSRDNKNVHNWIALAQEKTKTKDYAWAEAAYLEAMRLKPNDAAIIVAYLNVESLRRAPTDFIDEAERQLAKHPDMPELYLVTARGYRDRVQNKRNAFIIFNQFLKKFPENSEAAKVKAELAEMR